MQQFVKELTSMLTDLEHLMVDEAPPVIGEEYKAEFKLALDEERAPGGKKHAPLKPASMYPRKKSRDPANHILKDTNKMYDSADHASRRGETEIGFAAQDKRGRQYPPYHQKGNLPKMAERVIVDESPHAAKKIRARLRRSAASKSNQLSRDVLPDIVDVTDFG